MNILIVIAVLAVAAFGQLPHTASTGTLTINGTCANCTTEELKCKDFCVEELTSREVADLADAHKRLDEAREALDSVSEKIALAHGGYTEDAVAESMSTITRPCNPYLSVAFRGKYALIEYRYASCVSW